MTKRPVICRKKCNGCGLCLEVCACQALVLRGGSVQIRDKRECCRCTRWCTMCEMVCPTRAIRCLLEVVTED